MTGYECTPEAAAMEFAMDREQYFRNTGKEVGKKDVVAYHLRQSFKPGEITPEEANRLGYELAKTKDVYQEYHKHGNSKKFAAEHEQELVMHKAAKQAFDALGLKKLPTVKSLSAEYDQLVSEKKKLYAEYRQVHEQMTEMLTVRANMEQMLKQDEALKEQERSRANVR